MSEFVVIDNELIRTLFYAFAPFLLFGFAVSLALAALPRISAAFKGNDSNGSSLVENEPEPYIRGKYGIKVLQENGQYIFVSYDELYGSTDHDHASREIDQLLGASAAKDIPGSTKYLSNSEIIKKLKK